SPHPRGGRGTTPKINATPVPKLPVATQYFHATEQPANNKMSAGRKKKNPPAQPSGGLVLPCYRSSPPIAKPFPKIHLTPPAIPPRESAPRQLSTPARSTNDKPPPPHDSQSPCPSPPMPSHQEPRSLPSSSYQSLP